MALIVQPRGVTPTTPVTVMPRSHWSWMPTTRLRRATERGSCDGWYCYFEPAPFAARDAAMRIALQGVVHRRLPLAQWWRRG